jgi:DNA-directed RNA polymerase sigma subunit (sigma70/sigma32)
MSLEEIAEFMGVSRERVRQVEEMALYKLRKRGVHLDPN